MLAPTFFGPDEYPVPHSIFLVFLLGGPLPVLDFRHVITMRGDVGFMIDFFIADGLLGISRKIAKLGDAINDISHEMEPVKIIEDDHVKRRGGFTFFLIAPHVEIFMIGATIRETMNQPGIAMKGEDDGFIRGKEGIKLLVGQPMRMLALRLKLHEVYDIHHTHFQIGNLLTEKVDRG